MDPLSAVFAVALAGVAALMIKRGTEPGAPALAGDDPNAGKLIDLSQTGGLAPESFGGAGFVDASNPPAPELVGGGDPAKQGAQELLARTLWGEARGESLDGIKAVGQVIKNRVDTHYRGKTNYQAVILDPGQFSSWNPSDPNREKMLRLTMADPSFASLYYLAGDIITGRVNVLGSDQWRHYYNPQIVAPGWAGDAVAALTIGNHRFLEGVA